MKMKVREKLTIGLALAMAVSFVSACSTAKSVKNHPDGPGRGYGPPAHAPAHGYRMKTEKNVYVIYDEPAEIYYVEGDPEIYYLDGWYYRWEETGWRTARDYKKGDWHIATGDLPPGLHKKARAKREMTPQGKARQMNRRSEAGGNMRGAGRSAGPGRAAARGRGR